MKDSFRFRAERSKWMKVAAMITVVCICLCAGIFGVESSHANRAELQLEIDLFLDGQVKANKWLPVKLTVSNPGDDASGFLTWKIGGSRQDGDFAIVKQLQLPAGSTKELWVSVPGNYLHERNNEFVFYEDSLHERNIIPFSGGKKSIRTDFVSEHTLQIGVLASDADAFRFLAGFIQEGYDVRVHELSLDMFPLNASHLEQLDAMILNDFPSTSLTEQQVQALSDWVRTGGTLIVSGGAGYGQTIAGIQELAPVWGNDTISVQQLPALEQKVGEPLVTDRPFTLSMGTLTPQSEAWLWHEDVPLIVNKSFGRGTVWYVAMDFSLQPFTNWIGSLSIWRYVLHDHLIVSGANTTVQDRYWELENALEVFSQLKPPSLGLLAIAFVIYVLIVAPILYILLQFWDRRGLAWLLIPVIAISFSIGIYSIGAKDRGQTLAQSLSIVQLNGDGYGHRVSATSVFVPKGGSYEVKVTESKQAAPFWERIERNHVNDLSGTVNEWFVQGENDADRILFERVPYWSIRKFWMEDQTSESYGSFHVNMNAKNANIEGDVTNETGQTLTDVHIVYQGTAFPIGTLNAEETSSFQLHSSGNHSHIRNIPHLVFPRHEEDRYKRALLSTVLQKMVKQTGNDTPTFIVGFSEGLGTPLQIENQTITPIEAVAWVQALDFVFIEDGNVSIPFGSMEATLVRNDTPFTTLMSDGWMEIGEGELEFVYYLPQKSIGSRFHSMQMAYEGKQTMTYSLWNNDAKEWEPLDRQGTSKTWTAVDPYIVDGEFIRLKVTNTVDYEHLRIPEIALEGEIEP